MTNPGAFGRSRETCQARLKRIPYLKEQGKDNQAIADELGLTVETIEIYLKRAVSGWEPSIGMDSPAYDEENVAKIRKLYESGLTQKEVGERLGFSEGVVGRVMREFGIPARTTRQAAALRVARTPDLPYAPEVVAEVRRLYESGLPQRLVAQELGLGASVVHRVMRRSGIRARSASERTLLAYESGRAPRVRVKGGGA